MLGTLLAAISYSGCHFRCSPLRLDIAISPLSLRLFSSSPFFDISLRLLASLSLPTPQPLSSPPPYFRRFSFFRHYFASFAIYCSAAAADATFFAPAFFRRQFSSPIFFADISLPLLPPPFSPRQRQLAAAEAAAFAACRLMPPLAPYAGHILAISLFSAIASFDCHYFLRFHSFRFRRHISSLRQLSIFDIDCCRAFITITPPASLRLISIFSLSCRYCHAVRLTGRWPLRLRSFRLRFLADICHAISRFIDRLSFAFTAFSFSSLTPLAD